MKDSKTVREEHQSFVDAWKKIQEDNSSAPVKEGYKDVKKMLKTNKKGYKTEKVLVRKSGAFTALAEKYNMSPKQFGRYVEANQHLFDIPTRKKATLANKFQGFKETEEWDEFFGDLVVEEIPITPHDISGGTKAGKDFMSGRKNPKTGKPVYKLSNPGGMRLKLAHNELEGDDLQEITTKDTKSGTKFKVRVKDKKTGSSYIRFATRDKISQLRSDPKIASVEMTDEGQTPEERGEKKAQAAGGGDQKKAKKDYDGDGKVETGSQEYLGSRDKAIKKAMKKRSVTTEDSDITEMDRNMGGLGLATNVIGSGIKALKQVTDLGAKSAVGAGGIGVGVKAGKMIHDAIKYAREKNKPKNNIKSSYDTPMSDWRQDLKEIMGEVEKSEEKKKEKGKKAKNKIAINPDTDDEKNKYEEVNAKKLAENLGADLQSLKIEDADGNVAYEVVDLVKPDPIKEQNFLQTAVDKVKNIGGAMVKKYKENEAAKKKFRDENPGGTLTKKSYMKHVKDGTSSTIGMP